MYTPHSTLYIWRSRLRTPHVRLDSDTRGAASHVHTQRIFLPVSTSAAHLCIAGRRTLYTLHFTLYTLHATFYTLHFTHYTLHSTLHTLHCTLYTLPPPPGISTHLQSSPCGLLCLASLQAFLVLPLLFLCFARRPPVHVDGRTMGESKPTVTQLPPGTSASKTTAKATTISWETASKWSLWEPRPPGPPILTSFAMSNFSQAWQLAFVIRAKINTQGSPLEYRLMTHFAVAIRPTQAHPGCPLYKIQCRTKHGSVQNAKSCLSSTSTKSKHTQHAWICGTIFHRCYYLQFAVCSETETDFPSKTCTFWFPLWNLHFVLGKGLSCDHLTKWYP